MDAKGKPTKEPPAVDSDAPLATPGELLRRPTWKQRDGHVEQTSRGRNVFLVAQPEFTDFVLTLAVNNAPPKEITLPEDKARAGTIALATYGGNAEFADVRVTSLDGLQVLFGETLGVMIRP